MSRYLIQRIETAPNITLHTETEIAAAVGEGSAVVQMIHQALSLGVGSVIPPAIGATVCAAK